MKYILLFLLFTPDFTFSQIKGMIEQFDTKWPLVGTKIIGSNGQLRIRGKSGFIINNVLNAAYTARPSDAKAPRTFIVQLQMKF